MDTSVETTAIIDTEDIETWPSQVVEVVVGIAEDLRGTTEYVGDLPISFDEEDAFRATLRPHRVLAFHATRLLAHEVQEIRVSGLRPASEELIADRITSALGLGAITADDAEHLRHANVFAEKHHTIEVRRDVVYAFLGREPLDEDIGAIWRLLTEWGGEIVSMSSGADEGRLRNIGMPAVVVLGLDLSPPHAVHPVWPGLLKCMVGTVLGLDGNGADVRYERAAPPDQVLDIWIPGHPDFERYPELAEAV